MNVNLSRLISENFDAQQAKVWSQEAERLNSARQDKIGIVLPEKVSFDRQKIVTSRGVVSNSKYLSNRPTFTGQVVPKKSSGATDLSPISRQTRLLSEEEARAIEKDYYSLDLEFTFIRFFQSTPSRINNSEIIQEIPLSEVEIIPPSGLPQTTRFNIPLSQNSVAFSRGNRDENSYLEAGYDPNLTLVTNIDANYRGMRLAFVGTRGSDPANFEIAIAAGGSFPNSQGGWYGIPGNVVTISQIQIVGAPEIQFPKYRFKISPSPDPENLPITGAAIRVKRGDLYARRVVEPN